jgi:hypothetical protein
VLVIGALLLAAGAIASGPSAHVVSDGVLRVPVPARWSGSVGFGSESGHPVAWILVGDFAFPATYVATHEGVPSVPRSRLLISIGDFVLMPPATHWQATRRLRLPPNPARHRTVSWHVRFAGRAVVLSVRFGSRPTSAAVARCNRVLAGVRRRL